MLLKLNCSSIKPHKNLVFNFRMRFLENKNNAKYSIAKNSSSFRIQGRVLQTIQIVQYFKTLQLKLICEESFQRVQPLQSINNIPFTIRVFCNVNDRDWNI